MTIDDAVSKACSEVGIVAPRGRLPVGKWVPADTTSGKSGKGDGRIIVNEAHVTAFNWQTGETVNVSTLGELDKKQRREIAERVHAQKDERRKLAEQAAADAGAILRAAKLSAHPYLEDKGFSGLKAPVVEAEAVRQIAGRYLVPSGAESAIVVPARRDTGLLSSCQLIWEDGTKKFLYGGEMRGAAFKLCQGRDTWLCEGFATGLSVRAALTQMKRADAVLVCFSASNIAAVAGSIRGQCFIAADHDAPPKAKPEQFGGIGAGEFFARKAGKRYALPPQQGTDFDDLRQSDGLFAVQSALLRAVRATLAPP